MPGSIPFKLTKVSPLFRYSRIPPPRNTYWRPKNPKWKEDRPVPQETAVAQKLENNDIPQASTVPRYYINRNPCNLTVSGDQPKRKGFQHDSVLKIAPDVDYYYRLHLIETNAGLTAWVQHTYGKIVVRASTTDDCINHFLYSNTSVNAARQLGRIMAQRMKMSGIWNITWTRKGVFRRANQKADAFEAAIMGAGIALHERRNKVKDTHEPFRVIYYTTTQQNPRSGRPGLRRRELPETEPKAVADTAV
eukprot:scpid54799/ scgid31558/ 39S ribosomal protein L18, mitochondrial